MADNFDPWSGSRASSVASGSHLRDRFSLPLMTIRGRTKREAAVLPAGLAYGVHGSSALGPALAMHMLVPADRDWGRRRLRSRTLRVELANPANQNVTESLEVLVDPALVHSIVPTAVLERLGISPWSERDFLLADGSRVRRKMGGVLLKHRDHIMSANVIFGDEGESARLGKLALEALGFSLDRLPRREPKPGSTRPRRSDLQ